MASFPSVFSSFNRPLATDRLNSPSHSALHNSVSSALGQLEAVIGLTGASSVLGTIEGDLRSPSSGGGGHVQTAVLGGTGQTTFTKGDILVAQSASVLTKLAVGSNGQGLVADSASPAGISYRNTGAAFTSIFTGTTGVWFNSSTYSTIAVEMWSGGGSGGQRNGNTAGIAVGGGGGAYFTGIWPASQLPNAVSVIAAASVAGVSGNSAGVNGGNSYFGSVVSLSGGVGGSSGSGTTAGVNGGSIAGFSSPFVSLLYGQGAPINSTSTLSALYSSGSGGSDNVPQVAPGGNTIYGGAAGTTVASINGGKVIGGAATTIRGGVGGVSSIVTASSIIGNDGAIPGGGGSGSIGATSGKGASGQVIVYMW